MYGCVLRTMEYEWQITNFELCITFYNSIFALELIPTLCLNISKHLLTHKRNTDSTKTNRQDKPPKSIDNSNDHDDGTVAS